MIRKKSKKKSGIIFVLIILAVFISAGLYMADYHNLIPKSYYTGEDFNITPVYSEVDYNSNGYDDYTDILIGARLDAKNHPKYDGSYQAGGYPPDDIGVCSDVVWRAFKNAGYNLRHMVDADIARRPEAYPNIERPDSNIDFRRVVNLHVFFKEYSVPLTTDINQIEEWQGGDIVIFANDKHIGIVSDKRNSDGHTYIIHNGGQPNREEDILYRSEIIGHYRFDPSKLSEDLIVKWSD